MFDLMIQQARVVVTSGLCRGELEGMVAGTGTGDRGVVCVADTVRN